MIECLFTIVMATAHAGATMATDSIDLIDEDQARRMLFPLFKEVTHTTGSNTDKHFYEIRS